MLIRTLTISAVTTIFRACALLLLLLPLSLHAQDAESESMATPASMVSKYDAICAECHDSQGDQILAPTRGALRQMAPERQRKE